MAPTSTSSATGEATISSADAALATPPAPRWPFWAPTADGDVEQALDLAGVGAGQVVIDLGCGDGRVVEAVAARGARAIGVELRPGLVAQARERTARFGAAVTIRQADVFTTPLDADVIFCYLSPATMYRLRGRFAELAPGTRVVSNRYPIVGWRATRTDGTCFLYELPAADEGWAWEPGFRAAGSVIAHRSGAELLSSAILGGHAGPLDLAVSRDMRARLRVCAGATHLPADAYVPIDIATTMPASGEVAVGGLRIQGFEYRLALVGDNTTTALRKFDATATDEIWSLAVAARTDTASLRALVDWLI